MLIITSTTWTATATGSVVREVTCESCGERYSYVLSRLATGTDAAVFLHERAQKKAQEKAQANLKKTLATGHDDIPCPACGWHQSEHVAYIRNRSYPGLKNISSAFLILFTLVLVVLLVLLGISVWGNKQDWPSEAALQVCGVILLAILTPGLALRGLRTLLLLNYKPNG